MLKEVFSFLAIVLTFAAFLPYIRSIRLGATKPHVFSWIIWGFTTMVVFFAQFAEDGGLGSWPIGVSGVITLYIAWLSSRKRADTAVTRVDWAFLAAAFGALLFWFLTSDPYWTVVILTVVDLLGFGPTLRSSYVRPNEESAGFYGIFAVRNLLAILALERYSVTTALFPAVVGVGCLVVVALILIRRRAIAA